MCQHIVAKVQIIFNLHPYMTKQTPERFAKNVLWQLAGIRAALDLLQGRYVLEIASATNTPPKLVRKKMANEMAKVQKKLFSEMAASSHLS